MLNEKQRAAKRVQRDENRLARQQLMADQPIFKALSSDPADQILQAYRCSFSRLDFSQCTTPPEHSDESLAAIHVADMLTTTIGKVIQFAKALPGFPTVVFSFDSCWIST